MAEYSVSQMLLAEGEDLYNLMGPKTPTYRGWWNDPGVEAYKRCWSEQLPAHIKKIATLLGDKPSFTPPGNTVGEIYLLAMLHQVISCRKSALNCALLCPVCSHPARAANDSKSGRYCCLLSAIHIVLALSSRVSSH